VQGRPGLMSAAPLSLLLCCSARVHIQTPWPTCGLRKVRTTVDRQAWPTHKGHVQKCQAGTSARPAVHRHVSGASLGASMCAPQAHPGAGRSSHSGTSFSERCRPYSGLLFPSQTSGGPRRRLPLEACAEARPQAPPGSPAGCGGARCGGGPARVLVRTPDFEDHQVCANGNST